MRILRIKVLTAAIVFATASTLPALSQAGFCGSKAKHKQHHPYQQKARYDIAPRYKKPYAGAYYGNKRYPSARFQPRQYAYPDYYSRPAKRYRSGYAPAINQGWYQPQPHKMARYPGPKSSAKLPNKGYQWRQPQKPRQIYTNHQWRPRYGSQAYTNYQGYNRPYPGHRKAPYYGYSYPVKSPAFPRFQPPAGIARQAPPYYNRHYSYNQPQTYYRPPQQRHNQALANPYKLKYSKPRTELKFKPALQQIRITEKGFQPSKIKGDRVFWANVDKRPHQVSSHDGWQSEILTRGATYMLTFNEPGVYKFYSASNPQWYGQVQVK